MSTQTSSRESNLFIQAVLVITSQTPVYLILFLKSPDAQAIGAAFSTPVKLWLESYLVLTWKIFWLIIIFAPNLILWWRWRYVVRNKIKRNIDTVQVGGKIQPASDYFVAYLVAVVTPFWSINVVNISDLMVIAVALTFVLLLFWRLDIHYLNVFLLFRGYRTFKLIPTAPGLIDHRPFFIFSKKFDIRENGQLSCYALSGMILLEISDA